MKEFSIAWLLAISSRFFAVISASLDFSASDSKKLFEIEDDLDIKFGFFGLDEKADAKLEEIVQFDAAGAKNVVNETDNSDKFFKAFVAPVRGDRLNELKIADTLQETRFRQSGTFPARLSLRFSRDFYAGSSENYSMELLYLCVKYLELPAAQRDDQAFKNNFLKSMVAIPHSGSEKLSNTLLHPICYDTMKIVGESLELSQIKWLIEKAPSALFDNAELLTSLKDYSFIDENVSKNMGKAGVCLSIDFLSIPNFVKTVPLPLLLRIGAAFYEPEKHNNILFENRENLLEELASSKDNCRNYSFLANFSGIPNIPTDYIYNCSLITATIRTNGLTPVVLGALISYIQESNDLIMSSMMDIAMIWADVHKNSHISTGPTMSENINKEFNERVHVPFNNLLYLRGKRDDINKVLEQLEAQDIPAHPSIIKAVPDWLKHLKLLAHVPFHGLMRLSFNSRCSLYLQSIIHPDDMNNSVPLPRLASNESIRVGFAIEADPAYYHSLFLWSSLWRNVFFAEAESWRQDPEIMKLAIPGASGFEALMKSRHEVIYKDSASAKAKSWELLLAWQKLSVVLDASMQSGPRFCRFIASLSIPAPPEDYVLPVNDRIERQVFAKKVALAIKDIQTFSPMHFILIKSNLSDSHDIVSYIDKRLSMRKSFLNSHYIFSNYLDNLEKFCADFNSKVYNSSCNLAPATLFRALRIMENSFASLGKTLSDDQISNIASSIEISKYFAFHGRGLTRSQVAGLLKSDLGKKFLKSNIPLSRNLIDYSEFSLKDFEDIGLHIDDIRVNTSSVSQQNKLMLLSKQGFSSINDPILLVQSLGFHFWTDVNLFKNLSLWELLNPLVMAFDVVFTADCSLIYHISGMKAKLHSKILLNVAIKFLVKWLIAQDWYAFQYHVVLAKGSSKFGFRYINNLSKTYTKYVTEGENPARKDVTEFIQGIYEARGSENDAAIVNLAELSIAVDCAPLTPFRAAINSSASPLANALRVPFNSNCSHSDSLLHFVSGYIRDNFKGPESIIWQARLEILTKFAATEDGRFRYVNESRSLTRQRLNVLPNLDASVYRWALELEGVDVESIFRDTSIFDGPLEIDSKIQSIVIPSFIETTEAFEIPVAEAVLISDKKNNKKNKKNTKRNK